MSEDMTLEQVQAALERIPDGARPATVCAMIGHSRVITAFFGYVHCARCEAQIGDALGGVFDATGTVIVGHDCKTCRANAPTLTWRDTFMAPDPFDQRARAPGGGR